MPEGGGFTVGVWSCPEGVGFRFYPSGFSVPIVYIMEVSGLRSKGAEGLTGLNRVEAVKGLSQPT